MELLPYLSATDPKTRGTAATAIGLIAKRVGPEKVLNSTIAKALTNLIRDPESQARKGATYAFMRMPGIAAASALPIVLGHRDAEIRAMATRGLGDSKVSLHTLDSVLQDGDWRVRYEAAQAFGKLGEASASEAPGAAQRLLSLVSREITHFSKRGALSSGTSTHVLSAIIKAAGRLGEPGDTVLRRMMQVGWQNLGRFDVGARTDAARVHCLLAYALDVKEGQINKVRTCGSAQLLAWRRLELESRLLELSGAPGVPGLNAMLQHSDSKVRLLAAIALGNIPSPTLNKNLATLLTYRDPYVVSAAANWLLNPEIAEKVNEEVMVALPKALLKMSAQPDPNFVIAVIDAYGALGKKAEPILATLAPFSHDARPGIRRRVARVLGNFSGHQIDYGKNPRKLPYKRPAPLGGRPQLILKTSRGNITIEMFGNIAPRTVGAIADLAERGFYTDKSWHRIVPNFVAQGGCSRGDGWGGPGYAIDEETSTLPFTRGAVGIATNGRDTGGSQFFIMHSYHPHLDGAYTVFGQVREGMDVADALQPDDLILDAKVRNTRPGSQTKIPGKNVVR